MPAEIELDGPARLVRTRARDILTAGELYEVASRIRDLFLDGTIDAGWSELVDFREVTRAEMIPVDAVERLARTNPWPSSARRVIVAPAAVVFGMSRMYQLLASSTDDEIGVVRTLDEAYRALA
jgi:hypothetical protein